MRIKVVHEDIFELKDLGMDTDFPDEVQIAEAILEERQNALKHFDNEDSNRWMKVLIFYQTSDKEYWKFLTRINQNKCDITHKEK